MTVTELIEILSIVDEKSKEVFMSVDNAQSNDGSILDVKIDEFGVNLYNW